MTSLSKPAGRSDPLKVTLLVVQLLVLGLNVAFVLAFQPRRFVLAIVLASAVVGVIGLLVLWLARRRLLALLTGAALAWWTSALAVYFLQPLVLILLSGTLVLAVAAGHRFAAWVTAAASVAGFFYLFPFSGWPPGVSLLAMLTVGMVLAAVLLLAELVRIRRNHLAERRQRQIGDERLRISRELHDVIGHGVSLINVQAGVALHLLDEDPAHARKALTAIKGASREVLHEVRSTLGVLRDAGDPAPRMPAPSLTRLDELTGRLAAVGLQVQVTVTGQPRLLPANVDLAAYRIVQESLTNVHRHSGVQVAQVALHYTTVDLIITVSDEGSGGQPEEGNGLAGIRERVASLGGCVVIGPRQTGGFTVEARLPAGAHE